MCEYIIEEDGLDTFDIIRMREESGFAKRAEVELGETPEVRSLALEKLTEMLLSQKEFQPRMDQDYLLRFLRAKKFNAAKAYNLVRNFYRCRLIKPAKFSPIGVGPLDLKPLYDLDMGIILPKRNPLDGSVILIAQLGKWTPDCKYDLMDSYTPTAMAFDFVQRNPECQLHGFRFVFNLKGIEWRHLKYLYPECVRALMTCCQDGYPARFKGAHIVNNSYVWNIVWNIGKPLLNHKVQSRVKLHASDMKSLHEFISPEILPAEYEGTGPDLSNEWLLKEMFSRQDEYVKNSYYGYDIMPDGSKLKSENSFESSGTDSDNFSD